LQIGVGAGHLSADGAVGDLLAQAVGGGLADDYPDIVACMAGCLQGAVLHEAAEGAGTGFVPLGGTGGRKVSDPGSEIMGEGLDLYLLLDVADGALALFQAGDVAFGGLDDVFRAPDVLQSGQHLSFRGAAAHTGALF